MIPKYYTNKCTNDSFPKAPPNMTNCVWPARAAMHRRSNDRENNEQYEKKTTCEPMRPTQLKRCPQLPKDAPGAPNGCPKVSKG